MEEVDRRAVMVDSNASLSKIEGRLILIQPRWTPIKIKNLFFGPTTTLTIATFNAAFAKLEGEFYEIDWMILNR